MGAAREVLLWLVKVIGPVILSWSVQQLIDYLQERSGSELEAEREPYIWDQPECDPSERS